MADPEAVLAQASPPLPPDVGAALVAGVSELWLLSAPAEVLAGDLVSCHPPLAAGELRVAVRDQGDALRLTVVAQDRAGLLASTAGALAERNLSVRAASVTTWPDRALALHGITFSRSGVPPGEPARSAIGRDVAAAIRGDRTPSVSFKPVGTVRVVASPAPLGHSLVSVEASDRIGLLWTITSWFADHGHNVVAAQLTAEAGRARDLFVVEGAPDADALADSVARGRSRRRRWPGRARSS